MSTLRILGIAGARPNFMKIAPLSRAMSCRPDMSMDVVHTGQHYDAAMSEVFFNELGIPAPIENLGVGSGARLEQIDRIIERFDPVVARLKPDLVLVVGDVNSTIACARVAKAHGIPVAHVEAGLRSFDNAMPEEINRLETDRISDLLFVTEPSGMTHLDAENVPGKRFFVGNVMIDSLVQQLEKAHEEHTAKEFGLSEHDYFVGTFHRPSNVDDPGNLVNVVTIIEHVASAAPIVLPLHPRTRNSLMTSGLMDRLLDQPNVTLTEPQSYLRFLSLLSTARAIVTDSGGIQEESTYLGVPCITMRDNTERPVTVDVGTNVLAGTQPAAVKAAIDQVLTGNAKTGAIPELWDGHAAQRIVEHLAAELAQ